MSDDRRRKAPEPDEQQSELPELPSHHYNLSLDATLVLPIFFLGEKRAAATPVLLRLRKPTYPSSGPILREFERYRKLGLLPALL